MKTPICDFVKKYSESNTVRLHMPGHKGRSILGAEPYDITEISGADSLYEASGIIRESQQNASALFGTRDTFYSAEGSSLCIRAMLFLALQGAERRGRKRRVIAGRNAHRAFISAAALLDFDIEWLSDESSYSYLTCTPDTVLLEQMLSDKLPAAVYITSPDYLGNLADISEISRICRKYDTPLLVDNAHGSYLHFLENSRHPIDLGADICCDSAHKTLPVITGGAYLHISHSAPMLFSEEANNALSLFGSTSPSYLILQSLDAANSYIENGYKERLAQFTQHIDAAKKTLAEHGFSLAGDEPLKITIMPKSYGYTGDALAHELRLRNFECEFSDCDYTVLMLTCENGSEQVFAIVSALCDIPRRTPIASIAPCFKMPKKMMKVREALFADKERVPAKLSKGRIFASLNISCPPAVPIVVCGEEIGASSLKLFEYYGIEFCDVVKI